MYVSIGMLYFALMAYSYSTPVCTFTSVYERALTGSYVINAGKCQDSEYSNKIIFLVWLKIPVE
jgi:hypothetical protein